MRLDVRFSMIAAIVGLAGCTRSPHLASGPIQITGIPVVVRFAKPVHSPDSSWELCYEFSRPGDSRQTAQITAVMLDASGQRYGFLESEIDRRGEAVVCRIGKLTTIEAAVAGAQPAASTNYEAVELSSTVPLRLSGLRGGPVR